MDFSHTKIKARIPLLSNLCLSNERQILNRHCSLSAKSRSITEDSIIYIYIYI
jgi:hypothetical protein